MCITVRTVQSKLDTVTFSWAKQESDNEHVYNMASNACRQMAMK